MSKSLRVPEVCLWLWKKTFILVFLFLFFFPLKNVFASSGTDTMLGYWKFDGDASDKSGDGCTGSLTGGSVPDYSSNAPVLSFSNSNSINFNGTNSYVTFANQNNLKPTSALTFSTWIYLNAFPVSTTKIAGNYTAGNNNFGYFIEISPSTVSFSIGNGTSPATVSFPITGNLPVATWVHLAATWDGTTVRLFVNGTNAGSTSFGGPIAYSTSSFELGNFNGKLDDVRLYGRALGPSSEISDLALGKHLTSSWISTASTDYETPGNWSPAAVPDPYSKINIDRSNSTVDPILSFSESVAELLIGTGSSLDIVNYNFTLNDSGTFTNNGTLKLNNTQTLTGFTNDTDSGTIQITGSASTTGLKTDGSGTVGQYYNLIMASTGTITLNKDLIINHNLSLEAGTLDASTSNHQINVKGNWINSSGTATAFVPRNGTVSLTGTNQSISGSNTFYNLSKSTSTARTLTFEAGSTQTITHNLTFLGAGSTSQFLSLRSSTSGTRWKIDPQGTRDLSGLDVQDSYNLSNSPIVLPGINKNSGNNLGWTFDTTAPSLVLDPINSPTPHPRQIVTGTATETNVTVSLVSFRIDATTGAWTNCLAKDGTFDSSSEIFSCKPETDLSEGQHTVYVRAQDSNDTSTADNDFAHISFKVDTKPPDISSVSADPGSDSAKITWHTDENSDSQVKYGKSSDYGKSSSENENVKDHGITVSNLDNCTTYHYRVESKDAAGNEDKSSDHTFKTTGCSTTSSSGGGSSTSDTSSSTTSTSASTTSTQTSAATSNTTSTQSSSTASNTSGTTNTTTSAEPEPQTDFNSSTSTYWQAEHFGAAYCHNENICAGSADPDGDGVSNNDEFRLGTDPNSADSDQDGTTDSAEIESGHDPTVSAKQGDDTITYENPKESGTMAKEKYEVKNVEVVEEDGSKKLKISGKGPPNTYVTVYVYSDPIVLTVKTDSDGNWSYVLDQDVGDGQHEVYVAVTDSAGKVEEKSEPLSFIKTAEAVTIIPPAEASAGERAQSPTEAWYQGGIFFYIILVAIGLVLALASIGIYKHRMSKQSEMVGPEQNP